MPIRKGTMAAFVGVETLALGAANAWPQQAAMILTTAGVVVTGVLGLLALVDHYRINRRKEYDEANKVSLSIQLDESAKNQESLAVQLDESAKNQESMRASLHAIRNEFQSSSTENHELRSQLKDIGDRLFKTDIALNDTTVQLREALRLLDESRADRESIRRELEQTRALAVITEERLKKLESGALGGV